MNAFAAPVTGGRRCPRITPNLWFDMESKEAAEFYVSVFPNSKITNVTYMKAMLGMKKIDVAALKAAADGA